VNLFDKLRKLNLLLIEDDEWIRDSLRLFFESEGCNIITLETAEEGLNLIKNKYFDVIITDFRLPGIDGIEFVERLSSKQTDSIKILITAYGDKSVRSRASNAGIQEVIAKPFNSEVIEKSLRRLINKTETTRFYQ
jgi:DNA-binding NtrC family response regulator